MRTETVTAGATSAALFTAEQPARTAEERLELTRGIVAQADELLLANGAVILRNFGVASAGDFHEVVACFGEPFVEYLHGNSPRTAVHEGVWTSTEYPAEYDISLHNELSQSARWPDRLFFCCITAATTGGETPVSDGRAMLRDMDPGVRARFEASGVAYLQSMHGGYGLGRSWQTTYETDDQSKVEGYLRSADVAFSWTDDEDLRIRQVRPATRTHPVTGEQVWFNQADQFHVSNLPPKDRDALLAMVESEEELPLSATFGDGSQIPSEDLAHVRELARRNELAFPWQPGDIMMIDNLLVMHGRHAYTGSRQTLVAMT